ncbi:hypothetical protein J2W37_003005 [Variovorax paradoxus]|uniref:hypothetical protein n=1 Tax=Variovorax paradoxus TaxID=34073 RepID=UPI00277FE6D3|nr:hypothetical protein [Variovorax paradoxus]MDP9965285.1 hypothetical protein [Variovorax paradoxus]MDR6454933.1 hypothetical protein [Variovorax paradoxus]
MSPEHAIDPSRHPDAGRRSGSQRYWAPCLAVALLATSLFYVALKDLVHENTARAPALPAATMPAHVEPPVPARETPAPPVPFRAPLVNAVIESPPVAPAEPPAFVEVQKCVMPEGDALYSDGPCPESARASTLRLPRNLHAAAARP